MQVAGLEQAAAEAAREAGEAVMASRTTAFLLPVVCLFPLACRSYMQYAGRPMESTVEARKIIHRVLDQQPGADAPIQIEVTDEKFSMLHSRSQSHFSLVGFSARTSDIVSTAVYYDKIADILLSKRRGIYAVTILAANGNLLAHVFTDDQTSAERFIDALETMRRNPE